MVLQGEYTILLNYKALDTSYKKKEKRKAFDTTKILICHLIILKSEKLTNTLKLNDIDLRNIFKIKNS